jgi:tetratricopeptide (TPR) repeat protein
VISAPLVEAEEEAPALEEEVPSAGEIPDWLRDLDKVETEGVAAPLVAEGQAEDLAVAPVTEGVPLIDEIPDWLRDLDKVEVEEIAAPPSAEVEKEVAKEAEIPASLLALVAAGLLDEADLESAMAEMSEEELATQRAEESPQWLSELVEEEAPATAEAEPAPPVPILQEIAIPVTEMPAEEVLIEEAVAEELVLVLEEVVPEAAEPEPVTEEVIPEVAEPVEEALIEETVAEAAEPEPIVEEVVAEVVEPEPVLEEAVLEAPEEVMEVPSRADELLSQLKTRPRDYSARLELARLRYAEQDWDAALADYEKLITARRFLPDVVEDLESLVTQQVEVARVYHMLGDAYMQQDQLDEALEMYRLARQKLTKR